MNRHTEHDINDDMSRYYDKLAADYELIYSGGPSGADTLFRHDAAAIAALLPGLIGPEHLDLACGTGYWLQFYHQVCKRIVLSDRSPRMLAACRAKIEALGLAAKASLIQADLIASPLPPGPFDSALLGFFWSHLAPDEESRVFAGVRSILTPGGRLILIDSVRHPARERSTVQTRTLAGRNFSVRKRYLDDEELRAMEKRFGLKCRVRFSGQAFLFAEGTFIA